MKAPQVIYLCLTTAFWLVGIATLASLFSAAGAAEQSIGSSVTLITIIVALNLGLLKWGGFFRDRD